MKNKFFSIGLKTVLTVILCFFFAFVIWALVKYDMGGMPGLMADIATGFLRG